jgi:hypothetical protein
MFQGLALLNLDRMDEAEKVGDIWGFGLMLNPAELPHRVPT